MFLVDDRSLSLGNERFPAGVEEQYSLSSFKMEADKFINGLYDTVLREISRQLGFDDPGGPFHVCGPFTAVLLLWKSQ